jgi:hypothetical protein
VPYAAWSLRTFRASAPCQTGQRDFLGPTVAHDPSQNPGIQRRTACHEIILSVVKDHASVCVQCGQENRDKELKLKEINSMSVLHR